jgi:hypothetical protein
MELSLSSAYSQIAISAHRRAAQYASRDLRIFIIYFSPVQRQRSYGQLSALLILLVECPCAATISYPLHSGGASALSEPGQSISCTWFAEFLPGQTPP